MAGAKVGAETIIKPLVSRVHGSIELYSSWSSQSFPPQDLAVYWLFSKRKWGGWERQYYHYFFHFIPLSLSLTASPLSPKPSNYWCIHLTRGCYAPTLYSLLVLAKEG
jgi:hypothetical protein